MKQIWDFFSNILQAEAWPARWNCGRWSDFHGWLYIISSLAIWAAYFAIPISIFYLISKKKDDIPFVKILWLFMLFILSCGLTHLVDAVIFWYPAYRLSALVLLMTAIVSWLAVIALYKIVPLALSLKSPQQLNAIVIERTQQLKESNNNLIRLNQDIDSFIYSASHDLKSPVNNIEGLLHLLKDELENDNNPEIVSELIRRIEHSTFRVKSTVFNLTDIVKVQTNPYEDVQEINVKELINEIIIENEILVRSNETLIRLHLDKETLLYSRQALKSILYNLIINAVKYRSPFRLPEIDIYVAYTADNKYEITVKDNGLGIDLTIYRDKLFTLFKRFHDHIEGSGIGLYIIRKIIENKGGTINVESTVDVGSVFKIIL
jgi:chemotaxis family two-component system sensor kinase Cph1